MSRDKADKMGPGPSTFQKTLPTEEALKNIKTQSGFTPVPFPFGRVPSERKDEPGNVSEAELELDDTIEKLFSK